MRILFLSHRLPYAPNRGDRVRAFHLLREMSRWAAVDLATLVHDGDEASHVSDVRPMVQSVSIARVARMRNLVRTAVSLPTSRPVTHAMLHASELESAVDRIASSSRPELVFAFCTGVAPLALRPSLAGIPLVVDMVDVDSEKWSALSRTTSWPLSWLYAREARLLSRFEATICARARRTFVVNERERQSLASLAPDSTIDVLGNGVDTKFFAPTAPPPASAGVVFCGVMNYTPNVQGALWMANEVWPLVRERRPDARLTIVGSDPVQSVRSLHNSERGIIVTGRVDDVRPFLGNAGVAVAPLQTARGVQNKVLEALAAQLPVIVTSAVANGLPSEALHGCAIADDPSAFANAILDQLERTPEERRQVARRAVLHGISWEARLGSLKDLLQSAIAR